VLLLVVLFVITAGYILCVREDELNIVDVTFLVTSWISEMMRLIDRYIISSSTFSFWAMKINPTVI
jgi:hypothetical protein